MLTYFRARFVEGLNNTDEVSVLMTYISGCLKKSDIPSHECDQTADSKGRLASKLNRDAKHGLNESPVKTSPPGWNCTSSLQPNRRDVLTTGQISGHELYLNSKSGTGVTRVGERLRGKILSPPPKNVLKTFFYDTGLTRAIRVLS